MIAKQAAEFINQINPDILDSLGSLLAVATVSAMVLAFFLEGMVADE